jgi:hypothetical protein
MTEDHLDTFLTTFETYDQHEYVLMKNFSYSINGKAKEWYENILPGAITNWDTF